MVKRNPLFRMKYLAGVAVVILALLAGVFLTRGRKPLFHRDCGAGKLLVQGACQPIETALAVPGKSVYWVAQADPGANDANPGTRDLPWRTIGRSAQALQPGDSVIVRAGTYRETIRPARGGTDTATRITYAAYTGEEVVVSGADVLTAWTPDENAWRHPWTEKLCAYGNDSSVVWRREMIIVDGRVLRTASSRAGVVPGTFYVEGSDCGPTAIYVRLPDDSAPAGHTIEAAKRSPLFAPAEGAGFFRIIGFTFRHAANRAQVGAVKAGSAGSLIEENTVEWTNGLGIEASGRGHLFRGNRSNDNGQMGIGGSDCLDVVLEYNQSLRNNWKGYDRSWEAGGGKFSRTRNTTIRFHEAGDNDGPGIWFDIDNDGNTIEQSLIYRNQVAGLALELRTNNTILRNNVIYANRTYDRKGFGIITQASTHNTIVHNTFAANEGIGLWVMLDPERRAPDGQNQILNNLFKDNCQAPVAGDLCAEIDVQGADLDNIRSNRLDGNIYWRSNNHKSARIFYTNRLPETPAFYWGSDLTRWRAYVGGDSAARIADPRVETDSRLSGWQLTAQSPAIGMGVASPVPVPDDINGNPRPAVGADAGADQYINPLLRFIRPGRVISIQ